MGFANSSSPGYCTRSTAYSSGKTPLKFNGKAIERWLPVADRHGPFLGYVAHRQVDHFIARFIRGEYPMIGCPLAQLYIAQLIGFGVVNPFRDALGKNKEGKDATPGGPPRLADARIESIPFLSKEFQIELGFRLSIDGVDG